MIRVTVAALIAVTVAGCSLPGNSLPRSASTSSPDTGCSLYTSVPNPCEPDSNN